MKNIGIISEYNPFHNGHKYHLDQCKQITNYDNAICVISGNFIQRGLPAILDKWTRTKIALLNGIDLVIELPTYFSINSAESFACGSINILNSLNIIDNLCFGIEENNIKELNDIADILVKEPKEYIKLLKNELDNGLSFPKARENAILNYTNTKIYSNILRKSNNILGIEYLKALKKSNSKIEAIGIKRFGNNYNDETVSSNICSATAIRELLNKDYLSTQDIDILKSVVPKESFEIINENLKHLHFLKDFEREIIYMIRKMKINELYDILEVSEGLENTLKKSCFETDNIYELINLVKSKRFTQTKIQRILIHILLGMTKTEYSKINNDLKYIRILGFNKKGKKLLSSISQNTDIPIITSVNKYTKEYGTNALLEKDILSSNLYCKKYNIDYINKVIEL